jgi:hypothetical protein
MDCQNVQASIDAAINIAVRRDEANETMGAHVRSCRDCRRYSDETAALLTLLGAQPRIEAPADFDFKLRARLARAKSEPAAAKGLFEKLRASSYRFSWGQTAAATATLAVVATVTALHFSTGDRAAVPGVDQKNHQVAERVAKSVEPPVANALPVTVKPSHSAKSRQRIAPVTPIPAAVRTDSLNLTTESEVETEGKDYTWRVYDPDTGQFVTTQNRYLIGAENSASTMSKTLSFVPPSI